MPLVKNVKNRRSGAELLQDLNQNFFMGKVVHPEVRNKGWVGTAAFSLRAKL
jgi:hypothetical protein